MFKWFKYAVASVTGILILVGIIIGIIFTIIFNLYIDKQQKINATISSDASVESRHQSINLEKDTYVQKGILTFENYQRLEENMSYEETVKALGAEGRKASIKHNPDLYAITYNFTEKGTKAIDISISFLNDGLSERSFYTTVSKKSPVSITAEQFDKVKSGMSYEDVKSIIGGDGFLVSHTGFTDSYFDSQRYRYNGEQIHSEAQFTFQHGHLESKSQNLLE